jgi:hypothetical protein
LVNLPDLVTAFRVIQRDRKAIKEGLLFPELEKKIASRNLPATGRGGHSSGTYPSEDPNEGLREHRRWMEAEKEKRAAQRKRWAEWLFFGLATPPGTPSLWYREACRRGPNQPALVRQHQSMVLGTHKRFNPAA